MAISKLQLSVRLAWLPTLLFGLLALPLVACGGADDGAGATGDGDIVVSDVWARPALLLDGGGSMDSDDASEHDGMDMGGTNGAVYMTIENHGDEDDRLVAVDVDIAAAGELHSVNMDNGVMQMRPVEGGLDIPAGASERVLLEPGGLHVMLVDLTQALAAGDTFELELQFDQAGTITVEVEVREQ